MDMKNDPILNLPIDDFFADAEELAHHEFQMRQEDPFRALCPFDSALTCEKTDTNVYPF